ncbi:S24 family peptidase [Burkholderia vietnamiensis]|uniref:S24 family peptidase n=1 Tax=Burkholderia vietnamiensis TaxID=60552 RepID=UPI001CF3A26B|nr:helix-turn-helix transcriptional regulator [Burkholderia vietnamiensis]MCA8194136.1 helix-turn-helix transcriptional regulator [Burkholderia vietnamiensis]
MNTKEDGVELAQLSSSSSEPESEFHARMRLILDRWSGSEASFARAAKISQTGLNRIAQGGFPTLPVLVQIAETAGVSVDWLATGRGDGLDTKASASSNALQAVDTLGNSVDVSEFVFIPRYNVKAAAGHGQAVTDEAPTYTMAFRRYWIENYLHANPTDLSVLSVRGDSQQGVLNDRDVILIDRSQTSGSAGLYVLRIDGEIIVKTLQRLPGGILEVSSANPAYKPFEVNMEKPPADFAIIGRVVWFGRQV